MTITNGKDVRTYFFEFGENKNERNCEDVITFPWPMKSSVH